MLMLACLTTSQDNISSRTSCPRGLRIMEPRCSSCQHGKQQLLQLSGLQHPQASASRPTQLRLGPTQATVSSHHCQQTAWPLAQLQQLTPCSWLACTSSSASTRTSSGPALRNSVPADHHLLLLLLLAPMHHCPRLTSSSIGSSSSTYVQAIA